MRFFVLFLLIGLKGFSQKDSAIGIPLLDVHFGAQTPSGDLLTRFGPNLNAGGGFSYKTSHNWILGFDASLFWGTTVKQDPLVQLYNSDGFITDNEGYPALIVPSERGIGLHLNAGKLIPVSKRNLNSGILLTFGAGYLQHKILLKDAQKKVAALNGNLKKGYDHLSGGLSLRQFIGYMYIGRNRMTNFYGGFEFIQAFTRSYRKLNYSDGLPDTGKRLDLLYGIRVGWILPLYKKVPNDYYEY